MAYKRFIAAILIAAVFFAPGCSWDGNGKKLRTITMAFQDWVGYGPFYLARDKGFMKDEGIDLVFVKEELDSARKDALSSGMLDCEAGTLDLLISKRAEGVPVVAVMELDESFGSDGIVAVDSIKTLQDLAGKKVALARDDVGETFLSYVLNQAGIGMDKIKLVPCRPDDAAKVFLSGGSDAVVTWEPQLSESLKRPASHLLLTSRDKSGFIVDTLNVREDIVKKEPDTVRGLMRAWFRAVSYYRAHMIDASEIIAKYYGITDKEYRIAASGLRWIDYEKQNEPEEFAHLAGIFDSISDIKFSNLRIKARPDSRDSIYTDLLKDLYKGHRYYESVL